MLISTRILVYAGRNITPYRIYARWHSFSIHIDFINWNKVKPKRAHQIYAIMSFTVFSLYRNMKFLSFNHMDSHHIHFVQLVSFLKYRRRGNSQPINIFTIDVYIKLDYWFICY